VYGEMLAAALVAAASPATSAGYRRGMTGLPVTIVNACLRDGRGGSPTAVLADADLTDDQRRQVPARLGTSHAVFVSPAGTVTSLRFFTATGELPACGHGTVAALAYLAHDTPTPTNPTHASDTAADLAHTSHAATNFHTRDTATDLQVTLRTPGRVFGGRATTTAGGLIATAFDPGPVGVRQPEPGEQDPVVRALGLTAGGLAPGTVLAARGRPRLLIPVTTRDVLAGLTPDLDALRAACDAAGLLGCYVYHGPDANGRVAARMFAPSIGVPEDIANANSTACLAAHLSGRGITRITADMGDALGTPATITATTRHHVQITATATIARTATVEHI
jgi:trans-2,3-dihydro-3-hydroxyanthranilate isomerase